MIAAEGDEQRLGHWLRVLGVFALAVVLLVLAVWFLKLLGSAGIVIVAAILFSYLIVPVVRFFQRKLSLVWAIVVTYILILAVLGATAYFVVPPLIAQAQALIVSLPALLHSMQQELMHPTNSLVAKAPLVLRNYLIGLPNQINVIVTKSGFGFAQRTIAVLFSFVSLFLSIIILPVLAAYIFLDTGDFKRAFVGLIPYRWRPRTLAILADLNGALGAFVRGQVLDGLIVGTMVTVMLWGMHVPYALLIGVAAGFLNLVPYLGAIVGFIPSVLLAWAYNGWENALFVGILFGVIQQIDGNLILPRIMEENVQLSPLVVIVTILVFTALFGIIGTFVAVPVAAMIRVLKLHFAPAAGAAEMTVDEQRAAALRVF